MSIARQKSGPAGRGLRSRLAVGALALTLAGGLATAAATQSTAATAHKASVVHLTWWTMWSGASLTPVNQMVPWASTDMPLTPRLKTGNLPTSLPPK